MHGTMFFNASCLILKDTVSCYYFVSCICGDYGFVVITYFNDRCFDCRPSNILPSFLKRKSSCGNVGTRKKRKAVTTWDRDIICLPPEYKKKENCIPYPRGKFRVKIGLVGKIHLASCMSVDEVADEIRSAFPRITKTNPNFSFQYLQPCGSGARSLSVPTVSSSFQWTAQQVAKVGNQKNTIYILAECDFQLPDSESDVSLPMHACI